MFELAGEGLSPKKLPRLVLSIDVYLHLPMTKYTKYSASTLLSRQFQSMSQIYVAIGRGQAGGQVFAELPLALPGLLNTFLIDLFDSIVNH